MTQFCKLCANEKQQRPDSWRGGLCINNLSYPILLTLFIEWSSFSVLIAWRRKTKNTCTLSSRYGMKIKKIIISFIENQHLFKTASINLWIQTGVCRAQKKHSSSSCLGHSQEQLTRSFLRTLHTSQVHPILMQQSHYHCWTTNSLHSLSILTFFTWSIRKSTDTCIILFHLNPLQATWFHLFLLQCLGWLSSSLRYQI